MPKGRKNIFLCVWMHICIILILHIDTYVCNTCFTYISLFLINFHYKIYFSFSICNEYIRYKWKSTWHNDGFWRLNPYFLFSMQRFRVDDELDWLFEIQWCGMRENVLHVSFFMIWVRISGCIYLTTCRIFIEIFSSTIFSLESFKKWSSASWLDGSDKRNYKFLFLRLRLIELQCK